MFGNLRTGLYSVLIPGHDTSDRLRKSSLNVSEIGFPVSISDVGFLGSQNGLGNRSNLGIIYRDNLSLDYQRGPALISKALISALAFAFLRVPNWNNAGSLHFGAFEEK